MNTPERFVRSLAKISLPNVFNPYHDVCGSHDHASSAKLRRENLIHYLTAIQSKPVKCLWVGRDCGYRGARRTGIALTDEFHLQDLERQFGFSGITKATVGSAVKERTATEVWKVLRKVDEHICLWNIFPFHPFEAGKPLTNRRHTSAEYSGCKHVLLGLIRWLKPKRILAIGLDAQVALRKLNLQFVAVRHPSYGGQFEFAAAVSRIYGLKQDK
jgi:hypothetical protein